MSQQAVLFAPTVFFPVHFQSDRTTLAESFWRKQVWCHFDATIFSILHKLICFFRLAPAHQCSDNLRQHQLLGQIWMQMQPHPPSHTRKHETRKLRWLFLCKFTPAIVFLKLSQLKPKIGLFFGYQDCQCFTINLQQTSCCWNDQQVSKSLSWFFWMHSRSETSPIFGLEQEVLGNCKNNLNPGFLFSK